MLIDKRMFDKYSVILYLCHNTIGAANYSAAPNILLRCDRHDHSLKCSIIYKVGHRIFRKPVVYLFSGAACDHHLLRTHGNHPQMAKKAAVSGNHNIYRVTEQVYPPSTGKTAL